MPFEKTNDGVVVTGDDTQKYAMMTQIKARTRSKNWYGYESWCVFAETFEAGIWPTIS